LFTRGVEQHDHGRRVDFKFTMACGGRIAKLGHFEVGVPADSRGIILD
jgi:hypothetical protein